MSKMQHPVTAFNKMTREIVHEQILINKPQFEHRSSV